MKLKAILVAALSTTFLAACGGGGDEGSGGGGGGGSAQPSTTPGQAEGAYSGTFATKNVPNGKLSMAILENDEYWALYGLDDGNGGLTVYGFVQGQGLSNNGAFTSSNLKDYSSEGVYSGSLNVNYQTGISFSGTVVANGQSASIAGNTTAAGMAAYNTPANLADITGAWTGNTLGNSVYGLTISATGDITGADTSGCAASGTVKARASGKNVFDVNLIAANTAACGTGAGQAARGIGVSSVLSSGKRQLIIALVTADRTNGSVLFATR